jgi:DNA-binding transcriptional LysR family regulator
VTVAVAKLESRLGVSLFSNGRPKRLTAEGERLLANLEPLVLELRTLLEEPLARGNKPLRKPR